MTNLPPDLSRLGDVLAAAVAHDSARRARRAQLRRRALGAGAAGAVTLALAVPPLLEPAPQAPPVEVASAPVFGSTPQYTSDCDQPRGVRFTPPRGCVVLHPQAQAAR